MYRAIQKEGNTFTCFNEVTSKPTITRYTTVLDTERLLLWSRHFATRSPLAAAARNTFPRQLQTNFESFPNNCCISRDCRKTGYFIISMWKVLPSFLIALYYYTALKSIHSIQRAICNMNFLKLMHGNIKFVTSGIYSNNFGCYIITYQIKLYV
jgi:hypothetical protein